MLEITDNEAPLAQDSRVLASLGESTSKPGTRGRLVEDSLLTWQAWSDSENSQGLDKLADTQRELGKQRKYTACSVLQRVCLQQQSKGRNPRTNVPPTNSVLSIHGSLPC